MTWDAAITVVGFAIPIACGALGGYGLSKARHAAGLARAAAEAAEVALDALDRMEEAHDPGRDVQNRLAAVLEARMIFTSDGPAKPMPEARRAAAQAMAAQIIVDIRRADLVLSKGDANDD